MMFSFPQTLSRYQPIAEIGHGGMAEVILAQMRVGRGVKKLAVLKRLWPDLAAEPAFISMFLREARISALMNHPNIVQTYEVLEDTERPAIAMEYLDGQPLTRVMNRLVGSGGLTPTLRLRILADVLMALDYAHELTDYDGSRQGVVHRDVNPQNVIVTYDGQVKLVDFGLAKSLSTAYQTRAGGRGGKLSYMSPEQVRGGMIDRRADIFAAGVMLWEMMSGRRLWQGMSDQTIIRHLTARVPIRPLPSNPNLPYGLDRVCARALSIDPDRRFETAAEFAYEIDRLVPGGDDSHGRRLGRLVSLGFAGERAARRSLIEQHVRAHGAPFDEHHHGQSNVERFSRRSAGLPRGSSARVKSPRRIPTRLSPQPPTLHGGQRRAPPVAIWAEGDDSEVSSSGVTLALDAQSIISVESLPEFHEPEEDRESSRKTTVYVPQPPAHQFRWAAVGFAAALALMFGAGAVQFVLMRRGTQQASIVPHVPARDKKQTDETSVALVPPPVGATRPASTATLMSVLTNEPARPTPVHRPSPAAPGVAGAAGGSRIEAINRRLPDGERPRGPGGVRRVEDDVLPPSVDGVKGLAPATSLTAQDLISSPASAVPVQTAVGVVAPSTLANSPRGLRPIDTSDPFYP